MGNANDSTQMQLHVHTCNTLIDWYYKESLLKNLQIHYSLYSANIITLMRVLFLQQPHVHY